MVAASVWLLPLRTERRRKTASLEELAQDARRNPNDARVYYYQGVRLNRLGQDAPALNAFARAATLDGDSEEIWLAWASLAGQVHNDDEALQILHVFAAQHPQSARTHYALALLYGQKQVAERAQKEAEAAAQIDPRNADAWRVAGVSVMEQLDHAEAQNAQKAETYLRRAAAEGPKDWRNQLALGNALRNVKNNAGALAAYQEAARLAPDNPLALLALGSGQAALARNAEEREAARKPLERAIALAPGFASAYLALGQSYTPDARWAEASRALEISSRLDPANLSVHLELSRVYHHLNNQPASERESRIHQKLRDVEVQKLNLGARARVANDNGARLELARLFVQQGDYAQAEDMYRAVLAHTPDLAAAQREFAALEQRRGAQRHQNATLSPPGGESGTDPSPADLLRDADSMLQRKEYAEAERAYRRLLARDPQSALVNQGLGIALDAQDKSDEAFIYLNRAIKVNPRLADAQYILARMYYQAGMIGEVAKHAKVATEVSPKKAEYWFGLGLAWRDAQSQYAEAENAFSHALALEPGNAVYALNLADSIARSHRSEEAEAAYRHALALAPDNLDAVYGLGAFLQNSPPTPARQQEAETLLKKIPNGAPGFFAAQRELGRLAFKRGRFQQAVDYLLVAVGGAAADATTWYELGRAYERAGNHSRAQQATAASQRLREYNLDLTHTEELAHLHLRDPALRLKLARLYAKGGQNAKAINQYQVCQSLDPKNATPRQEMNALIARLTAAGQMPSMNTFNGLVTAAIPLR